MSVLTAILAFTPTGEWPSPLRELAAEGRVRVERLTSAHEVAAAIALADGPVLGILVDAAWLSRQETYWLGVVQRHTSLPIWRLPIRAGERHMPRHDLNIRPWSDAVQAMTQIPRMGSTPQVSEGSSKIVETTRTGGSVEGGLARQDGGEPGRAPREKTAEIPVVSRVVGSYDETQKPSLSPEEIKALLGPSE